MRNVNWMVVAATALFLSAGSASAGDSSTLTSTAPAATAPAATSNTSDPADEIVCKSMAPPTGSRLGSRRICQTGRQWQAQEQAARDAVQHEQNRGALFSTPAG
ncbi:MAG TPA: hypothetical protein VII56_03110 [Rhizomicrobium sp.]